MKNFLIKTMTLILCVIFTSTINSQTKLNTSPTTPDILKATATINLEYKYVPSIREQIENGTFIPADPEDYKKMGPEKKRISGSGKLVPGKNLPLGKDPLIEFSQDIIKKQTRDPILTFQTTTNTGTPGDPTGEVGRDYYIASWNQAFRAFNLDGTAAFPAASLSTLFGSNESGDPIVLYDSEADRYIVSSMGSSALNFAISESNDLVNDGWHVYSASNANFPTNGFPDYPKYSIWSDAYYATVNPTDLYVLERDKILNGDTTASLQAFTNISSMAHWNFASSQILDIVDDNHPAPGNATLIFLQDDAYGVITYDHIKLWTVNIDWNNPSNSSISNPTELATTPFNSVFDATSFSNLQQPSGPDIDACQGIIMNQAQFRKFSNHNSAIFNFVVNTAITGELAGIRWYELRQDSDGQPWTIYQEGTYIAPEGRHAWMGSMSMDLQGNIGMGYSSMSTSESVSLRYTGRYATDPLGTMTLEEGLIAQSTGNSSSLRYADYAHMSVDPINDKQFWFVGEYFSPGRSHMTGTFQIAANFANDVGVVNIDSPVSGTLTASEDVTVTIFNYGENDASNFDVTYQVDGGFTITETYTETIGSALTDQYTFTATTDMSTVGNTYSVTASTAMSGDEDNTNDSYTTDVSHLN
ncbi:MAG: hypothetical protein ABGY11_03130, partial [Candidatus Thioglobus sp.]